jgi:hypothetical protein
MVPAAIQRCGNLILFVHPGRWTNPVSCHDTLLTGATDNARHWKHIRLARRSPEGTRGKGKERRQDTAEAPDLNSTCDPKVRKTRPVKRSLYGRLST